MVIGDKTLFPDSKTVSSHEITDGHENMILVVERMIPVNGMDGRLRDLDDDEQKAVLLWECLN